MTDLMTNKRLNDQQNFFTTCTQLLKKNIAEIWCISNSMHKALILQLTKYQ